MRIAIALLTVLASAAQAQQPDDRAEVRRVVQSFFDAMRMQDTAALRATMLPGTRLVNPIRRADSSINVRVIEIGQLLAMVMATAEPYDERMPEKTVAIDTDLATVWGRYTFRVGQRITNCGMNAFQLLRTDAGWKIAHIASTIETTGCS